MPSGTPPHAERVRIFAALLGWSVGLGVMQVGQDIDEWFDALWGFAVLAVVLPIAAGLGTYRLTLWYLLPPSKAPLPAGAGFDVVQTVPDAEDVSPR